MLLITMSVFCVNLKDKYIHTKNQSNCSLNRKKHLEIPPCCLLQQMTTECG